MDRLTHLNESRNLIQLATQLRSQGQLLGAAEFIWGATVHAVSAADHEHEQQPPDRFDNPHQSPNTKATFLQAALRIRNRPLSETQIKQCLDNGQRRLHNHFYHLNLPADELPEYIAIGLGYAQVIIRSVQIP